MSDCFLDVDQDRSCQTLEEPGREILIGTALGELANLSKRGKLT